MGGMCGYLGATVFTLAFGILVTQIGYSPLFVVLAAFDIVAALLVWKVAKEVTSAPAERPATSTGGNQAIA